MQEATERLGQLTRPEEPAQAGTHAGGTAPDAGERQEDFEELIRGRYKADFDARVKKILDGRLRGLRQEVTELRQREKLRQVQIQYYLGRLPEQEPEVRRVCTRSSGCSGRWTNPRLCRLVQAGVEPREAYEMVHRRELTAKAMHFAAQVAARQAVRVVESGGRRIPENAGRSASVSRPDPGKLTSQELADIRKRVMDGEKISF
ncbi:MAG: hypothetical protein V8S97_02160 [Oscillospiraceae bacterium]